MRYASVCSGIEAPTVAWEPLGWKAAWFSEIEPFPCAVLNHHYPSVPNLGDMTKIHERTEFNDSVIDVLIGGTPCQSFSVAGLRKGLADPRGNLALVFLGLIDRTRPSWVVWENVPGVLSSNGGRDFGAFIGGLAELGYGFAYRVLDAQYFGVPQRRRRVFVVGYLGDWRPAAAVLFERHSLSGDTPPSRKKGERVAPTIANCLRSGGDGGVPSSRGENLVFRNHPADCRISEMGDISDTVTSRYGTGGGNTPYVMAHGQGNAEIRSDGSPSLTCNHEAPIVALPINTQVATRHKALGERTAFGVGQEGDPAFTLGANHHHEVSIRTAQTSGNGHGISENVAHTLDGAQGQAVAVRMREGCAGGGKGPLLSEEQSLTLATNNDQTIFKSSTVRRLTPRECERLQGFPDDYTLIDYLKRANPRKVDADWLKYIMRSGCGLERAMQVYGCPDGPRYKALGNSMAVPVIRWLGERIQAMELLTHPEQGER